MLKLSGTIVGRLKSLFISDWLWGAESHYKYTINCKTNFKQKLRFFEKLFNLGNNLEDKFQCL